MLSNSVNELVVNEVEVEKSRIIQKIEQRNEAHHLGEDHSGNLERHQTHQDSAELSVLTKVLMCLSRCSDRFPRFKLCTVGDPKKWIWVGPPIR